MLTKKINIIISHLKTTKFIPTESRFNDETNGIKSDSRFLVKMEKPENCVCFESQRLLQLFI